MMHALRTPRPPRAARKTGSEIDVQITRSSLDTNRGPSEWFTGAVYVDAVAAPAGASRVSASSVHFTPGARTAWHTHPNGQTIFVLEGVGLTQRQGGPIEVIRPGDRVFFEPGEVHWHGAAATRFMTHIALLQVDEAGNSATWGAHVSDEEYAEAPAVS
jgi:quercetin dioxygenase-like cupin family protein